ncbi:MAG: YbjN domain-containing protein, partial [Phreatobacter sp.]
MMKRPPIFATLAALAALTAFAPTADAQKRSNPERGQDSQSAPTGTVGRIMPQQMAAVLRNRGMQAEVISENNRSRIRTMIGGRRVTVFFYACNDSGCQSIQYRALYEKNDRFTLAFVNAWNYEKRFAKTYLDSDNDLVLEWDVDFDGGVNVGFISESVATFQTMINAFDRFTPRASGGGSSSGGSSSG